LLFRGAFLAPSAWLPIGARVIWLASLVNR